METTLVIEKGIKPTTTPSTTGRHTFPSPAEIPALMGDLAQWLQTAADTPETAFTAHRRLVDIHPFNDGNGRTARLLMNRQPADNRPW